jgi:hypothetical protein
MGLYACQFPGCETKTKIRSKVKNKESKYFGLLVCNFHANQLRVKTTSDKTRRTKEARKEQRKNYPEFYQKHIDIASKKRCAECNKKLTGNVAEIAHIIMKSTNNELATIDENIIYLCADTCHHKFDTSLEKRKKMHCFNISLQQYKLFRDKIQKHSSETLFYENLI